jgi:hypothetical protein
MTWITFCFDIPSIYYKNVPEVQNDMNIKQLTNAKPHKFVIHTQFVRLPPAHFNSFQEELSLSMPTTTSIGGIRKEKASKAAAAATNPSTLILLSFVSLLPYCTDIINTCSLPEHKSRTEYKNGRSPFHLHAEFISQRESFGRDQEQNTSHFKR